MNAELLVRVLRGTPTLEETAALVAILATRTRAVTLSLADPPTPHWVRSGRPTARPASWRASRLPTHR